MFDEANTNSRKEKETVFIVKGGDLAEKYKKLIRHVAPALTTGHQS